ncbi:hypothetical protein SAMN04487928_12420 [Butyrivibrio proteoclasticus]|uniref:Uncharacterized protein n=1 Tax=Butyrivibrio proteoclasticus TaxID=43305 RepID=A0A1I5WPA7_9FIRM|nr:hypothetical protein SAMN04487928_12420 [Butyrivibrio proteoclasticus]
MPMAICVFVIIISFAYYLYGRCILSQDTYILAFRTSILDTKEYTKTDEKLGNKYFGSTKPVIKTEVNENEVIVRGYANVRTRAMGNFFLMPKTGWDYMAAGKAKDLSCIKHIRKIKRYKDIGEGFLE